ALVDVVAAQVGVAVGRLDLDHTFAHFENRDIEGAATEIVDGDGFVLFLIQAVSQRRRRGLVDDAHDFETGDPAGVLGGLALRVVEVGRNGDHGLGHLFAQIAFGGFLELGQNHGGDFGRRVILARDVHAGVTVLAAHRLVRNHLHFFVDFVEAAPHETFDGENRVLGVGDRLPFGHLPHQALSTLGERHNGRSGALAFLIGDYRRLPSFHYGHTRVRGAQIDAYNLSHLLDCLPRSYLSIYDGAPPPAGGLVQSHYQTLVQRCQLLFE